MVKIRDNEPTRFGYGRGLIELGNSRPDVVVFDADLAKSTTSDWFAEKFPDRFYDVGIAEQNMLCIAAGMSLGGYVPFVTTYGVFVAGRAWDQIRTTVCYSNLNVKIAGAHGGISVGPDGATHQALEDIATMRVLPNMTVLSPCDAVQAQKATVAAAHYPGPVYLRFGREAVPVFTPDDEPFVIGKAQVYQEGTDVALIATGHMVYNALVAAEQLAQKGVSAHVLNVHTIKPLDADAVIDAAKKCGRIVCCEEHQVTGGLGGAVAELLAQHLPCPMRFVGVQDRFGESGQPDELMERFGLTANDIAASAMDLLK